MPIPYFTKFPTTLYDIAGNGVENLVINIVHRAKIRDIIINNVAVYYPYIVQDTDTPEIIAAKYYGSPQYHWLVLMANDIINPYFDWPLTYDDFNAAMNSLYGDLRIAKLTLFQYLDIYGNVIDQLTYEALPSDERSTISAYDYYYNLNETKRNIKLVDKMYLNQIDTELTNLLSGLT